MSSLEILDEYRLPPQAYFPSLLSSFQLLPASSQASHSTPTLCPIRPGPESTHPRIRRPVEQRPNDQRRHSHRRHREPYRLFLIIKAVFPYLGMTIDPTKGHADVEEVDDNVGDVEDTS